MVEGFSYFYFTFINEGEVLWFDINYGFKFQALYKDLYNILEVIFNEVLRFFVYENNRAICEMSG